MLIGILRGFDKKYFTLEERQAHETLQEHSASKKGQEKIREENIQFMLKPLTVFLEERLGDYVLDSKFPLLKELLITIVQSPQQEKYGDFLDEFYRQIQKKVTFGAEGKGLILAHPDTHRMLKLVV